MLYIIIKKMIERKNTDNLAEKIDVFYAYNKLTKDEYRELIEMLKNNN